MADRLVDRSPDLMNLANDALRRQAGGARRPGADRPLNDDRRERPDAPAQKIRHPRNVRILPPSRDFIE